MPFTEHGCAIPLWLTRLSNPYCLLKPLKCLHSLQEWLDFKLDSSPLADIEWYLNVLATPLNLLKLLEEQRALQLKFRAEYGPCTDLIWS